MLTIITYLRQPPNDPCLYLPVMIRPFLDKVQYMMHSPFKKSFSAQASKSQAPNSEIFPCYYYSFAYSIRISVNNFLYVSHHELLVSYLAWPTLTKLCRCPSVATFSHVYHNDLQRLFSTMVHS